MSNYLKINHNLLITLGQYLRNQRIKKNIGLREMAKKLEISGSYLSNLEAGKHSMANPLLLKRISEILEIDHLKLYKIVGYTDLEVEEILKKKNSFFSTKNLDTILNSLEKFDNNEFELVKKYIESIEKSKE